MDATNIRKVARGIIFHVDMDQFFAAVEEREHPKIKGRPVVVGADPKGGKGRGVVRKFGIHSGMPISRVWKLCPEAIYLVFKLYVETSSRIMKLLRKQTIEKIQLIQWGLSLE